MAAANLEQLVARLENVTVRLESVASKGSRGGGAAVEDTPEWLDDFNKFSNANFAPFIKSTAELGGDLTKMGELLGKAFEAHKNILLVAARHGRPSAKDLPSILKPLSDAISAVQNHRESNRKSAQFNHLSAVSEIIPFLGWVAVEPKPANYIKQMEESGQFYSNKILKEFRQSEPKQADWAASMIKMTKAFADHVKDYHGTGLSWSAGKPPATGASAAAPAPGGPPPPPPAGAPAPPPPPPPSASSGSEVDSGNDTRAQLFSQLNKGTAVTSGLKKVTDDMKTHKNPALRNQGPVAATKSSALSPRPYSPPQFKKFNAPVKDKPPVFELQQKKWIVEWQKNNQTLVIDETNDKQTIYMFKCENSVLQVKGKVNSITLDSCKKCGIVFEDLISTCEFVNCQSIKAQANGKVPTISVDKTDGAQIYLNEKSQGAQVITAKSSEMNICITKDDGDFTEFPVPEQFKTIYDGKKLVTTVMEI